jgi:hypothetical protein
VSADRPRDLGGGLSLRRARREDAEPLARFNGQIHRADDAAEPDRPIEQWTRDLLLGPHPTVGPEDFTLVEEAATGRIVSSLNLISQSWSYAGVPFGVGRVELVGTDPDYRRRGLVRAQFEVVHEWSRERGELLQAITGIPWYYRQFGYEYALALGGSRTVAPASLRQLEDGAAEPFRLRPATETDCDFLAEVDAFAAGRYLVALAREAAHWRHELTGPGEGSTVRRIVAVIETPAGQAVGFLARGWRLWGSVLGVDRLELRPGVSWAAVLPSALRALGEVGRGLASADVPFTGILLPLGVDHPAYAFLPERGPRTGRPYAWYLRVPDLPAFLRRIAPAIEARLAGSAAAGHSGPLRLGFYRSALELRLEAGRLVEAESRPYTTRADYDAHFPELTFLQLLFGHRSLEELWHAFPDCYVRQPETAGLLEALFPRRLSFVWGVG